MSCAAFQFRLVNVSRVVLTLTRSEWRFLTCTCTLRSGGGCWSLRRWAGEGHFSASAGASQSLTHRPTRLIAMRVPPAMVYTIGLMFSTSSVGIGGAMGREVTLGGLARSPPNT